MALAQVHSSRSLSVLFSVLITLLLAAATTVHAEEDRLTPEEVELVSRFRVIVKDLTYKDWMTTDEYLVRWLRVRNYSLQAARDMLKEALEWRKSNGIDSILVENFSDIDHELQVLFEGEDNEGRPLLMMNIGTLDVRKLTISGRSKKLLRFFIHCLEMAETALRDMNTVEGSAQNLTRIFIVLDMHGFNLRQHACAQCIPFVVNMLRAYESYYPDRAYKLIGINVPRIFMPVFELVRPFLSDPTRKAIELFDNNADRWKEELRNKIPIDQLPKQYGGTRTVLANTIGGLRKRNPFIKAVYDRAMNEKLQSKAVTA